MAADERISQKYQTVLRSMLAILFNTLGENSHFLHL